VITGLKYKYRGAIMKVYISFDYEGIGGVTFWKETIGDPKWNAIATKQLKAFIEGIKKTNQDANILVSDSHSLGDSILWEQLEDVELVRGSPRTFYMVEGLDSSFTDLVLFGYHTAIGGSGMMDHSYSSSAIYSISINGELLDEARINAYYAWELDVPLSFIYGDRQAVESSPGYPNIGYCISKEAITRFSGKMRPENQLLKELFEEGQKLGSKRVLVKPKSKKDGSIYPLEVEIEFADTARAAVACILPQLTKVAPRKAIFKTQTVGEFYRLLNAITTLCSSIKQIQ
jgi:D-amino peptidase